MGRRGGTRWRRARGGGAAAEGGGGGGGGGARRRPRGPDALRVPLRELEADVRASGDEISWCRPWRRDLRAGRGGRAAHPRRPSARAVAVLRRQRAARKSSSDGKRFGRRRRGQAIRRGCRLTRLVVVVVRRVVAGDERAEEEPHAVHQGSLGMDWSSFRAKSAGRSRELRLPTTPPRSSVDASPACRPAARAASAARRRHLRTIIAQICAVRPTSTSSTARSPCSAAAILSS